MNNSSGGIRKGPEDRVFPLFISLVILGFFVMLLANISVMYFGRGELSAAGFPYFFILLVLIIVPFNISLSILMAVLTLLYIVLFSYLILESRRTGSKRIFRNPSSYVGAFIPFLLLISLVIELLEQSLGVKIGGSSITSAFPEAEMNRRASFQMMFFP